MGSSWRATPTEWQGGAVNESPGSIEGGCGISNDGLVARCRIGRGRATVIADADLLNVEQLGILGEDNLDALLAELAELER